MLAKLQDYLKNNWILALEVAIIAIGAPYYFYVLFITFF